MRLYLVQHGDAVPKDVDPGRPLSDQGRADIKRLTEWLSRQNVQVAQILHSGKSRAKETAEILRPLLESPDQIFEGQGLAPNDSPEAFLRELRDSKKDTAHRRPHAVCGANRVTGIDRRTRSATCGVSPGKCRRH